MDIPRITVTRPRLRYWQWIALRLGLPVGAVLVLGVVAGIKSHNSAVASGALLAAGAAMVVAAIEVPLINNACPRRGRKALQSSPAGTLLAVDGSQIGYLAGAASGPPGSRTGPRSGRITVGQVGVSFRAARNGRARDTSLAWKQLSRVDVTPGRSPIDVRLKVVTADGQTVTWLLRGFGELSAALSRLQLTHNDRTGPTASR